MSDQPSPQSQYHLNCHAEKILQEVRLTAVGHTFTMKEKKKMLNFFFLNQQSGYLGHHPADELVLF